MEHILEATGWYVEEFLDSGDAAYIGILAKS